jgi:hypothetical protein
MPLNDQERHERGYDTLAKVDQEMPEREQGNSPLVHPRFLD